jgi:hypothetical protein
MSEGRGEASGCGVSAVGAFFFFEEDDEDWGTATTAAEVADRVCGVSDELEADEEV